MQRTIEVVYEKGMFKPLMPVELKEGEQIRIEIKEKVDKSEKAREILDKLRRFTSIRLKPEKLEEMYLESSRY
jgi:predicted DNA-binding antitoxin AbrB/MazE fold protein